jgi:hypothetical protein
VINSRPLLLRIASSASVLPIDVSRGILVVLFFYVFNILCLHHCDFQQVLFWTECPLPTLKKCRPKP